MCAKTRGETIELQGRDRNEQRGDLWRVFLLVPDQQCERLLCLSRNTLRKSFSQLLFKRIFTARETRRSGSRDAGCRSGIKPEQGCASLGDGRRGERRGHPPAGDLLTHFFANRRNYFSFSREIINFDQVFTQNTIHIFSLCISLCTYSYVGTVIPVQIFIYSLGEYNS